MSSVVIRAAGPDDLAAVAGLRWRWEQEGHGAPATPREDFVPRFVAWARAHEHSHRCTVVVRDGAVIGMAWLAVTARVPTPRSLERATGDLQSVYVVPEERDRGLGSRLIDSVLALAHELGLERVVVHSSERATSAYQRSGFSASPKLLHAFGNRPH